jgi:vibriolysin
MPRYAGWDVSIDQQERNMALQIQTFTRTSGVTAHPFIEVPVPQGFKILGGGAFDHWTGAGSLLTASYPLNANTWFAAGKDHEISSPAAITAYAIALHDPNDEWDVHIKSEPSNPAPHPQAIAVLPAGYVLTGGGAFVNWHGAGNLLTASFPTSDTSWEVRSKDHDISDPSQITAYAIGIRPKHNGKKLHHEIRREKGAVAAHPTAHVQLDSGWSLSGGGALDDWHGAGNLLTASFPQGESWVAFGKDHKESSPAAITAYAIGLREG